MPPRRTARIVTIALALVAVAAAGGSADPLGPSEAGRPALASGRGPCRPGPRRIDPSGRSSHGRRALRGRRLALNGQVSGAPSSPDRRWAMRIGMVMTTTMRHGDHVDDRPLVGQPQVVEDPDRQGGLGPGGERRDDHLVEGQREREQRPREERPAQEGHGDVPERLDRARAQVRGSLVEGPRAAPEPGDRVVVDDHHAERGVAGDDREQPEWEATHVDRRVEGHPGHDPGQGQRQDQDERDRPPSEEPEAVDGERRQRAQGDGDDGGPDRGLDRQDHGVAQAAVVEGRPEPLGGPVRDRPRLAPVAVERVQDDDQERDVQEQDHEEDRRPEEDAAASAGHHSASNAPSRPAAHR